MDIFWTSLVAQTVKHLSTMRETWVRSLGGEDSLEKEMATHSSICHSIKDKTTETVTFQHALPAKVGFYVLLMV